MDHNKKTVSYASATRSTSFPKKDSAILIDCIDKGQIDEYTRALGQLVPPSEIRFISKVANNRICAYLANKQCVDDLLAAHKHITV